MKILFIDFSQKPDLLSAQIIESFSKNIMTNAENDINTIKIDKLNIQPCKDCTKDITFEYHEKCGCDDDMNNLYPLFNGSDFWIFIIPLINNNTIAYLHNFLDRMEPLFQPIIFINNGSGLVPQESKTNGKIALLATCNDEYFSTTLRISEELSSISMLFSKEFAGSLIRNNIAELNKFSTDDDVIKNILSAAEKGAFELMNDGIISVESITDFSTIEAFVNK